MMNVTCAITAMCGICESSTAAATSDSGCPDSLSFRRIFIALAVFLRPDLSSLDDSKLSSFYRNARESFERRDEIIAGGKALFKINKGIP